MITDAILLDILNVYLGNTGSPSATWYIGLISGTNFVELDNSDTMATHPNWQEATSYSEGTRQTWTPTIANFTATNAAAVVFTMNGGETIKGIFLTDSSTKGGTTGKLWATQLFDDGDQVPAAGEKLRVFYNTGDVRV